MSDRPAPAPRGRHEVVVRVTLTLDYATEADVASACDAVIRAAEAITLPRPPAVVDVFARRGEVLVRDGEVLR